MVYRNPPTLLGGIFLILVGAYCIYVSGEGLLVDMQFDGTPRQSTGRIESVWWSTGRYHGGGHVKFDYVTTDGVELDVATSIMPDTYARLHVGDQVPVEYFLQNPQKAWINWPSEGLRFWWLQDAGYLAGGVLAVILGLFSIQMSRPQSEKTWEDAAVDMKPFRRDE